MKNSVTSLTAHTDQVLFDNGSARIVLNRRQSRLVLADAEVSYTIEDATIGDQGESIFANWNHDRWKMLMFGKPAGFNGETQINALRQIAHKNHYSNGGMISDELMRVLCSYFDRLDADGVTEDLFATEIWPNFQENIANEAINEGLALSYTESIALRVVFAECPVAVGHHPLDELKFKNTWQTPLDSVARGYSLDTAI